MNHDCPFCRIVDGDEPAHVVYEDEDTIAFLDDKPAVVGHVLVVPKSHREELLEDERSSDAVFRTVRTVASGLQHALDVDGFSVLHSTGSLVGTVTHAHVHVLPRTEDDDVTISLVRDRLDEGEANGLATRIRSSL